MRFWYERMPYLREFARSHRVLQLGVGEEERFGVALDINESVKPDVVLDLDKPPYPFPDNSFDAVYGFSVIEHLSNFFAVIEEVYRLLRPGGFLAIITPHFSNDASFIDPTHRLHLSARSFDYFIDGTPMWSSYQFYSKARFKTRHRLLMLERPWSLIPGLQHATNRYVPFYEKHLCYLIRGQGIYFELEALK